MKRLIFITSIIMSPFAQADDIVPFTASSIKNAGAGFVEIIGPARADIDGVGKVYHKTLYISVGNINSMSSITKTSGCTLYYSSKGYTENISLANQSCVDVLKVLSEQRK